MFVGGYCAWSRDTRFAHPASRRRFVSSAPCGSTGSVLDEEQTRFVYETRTVSGDALPVDDVVGTMNSFELFDEMLDAWDEPITADLLKRYTGS